MFQRGSGFSIRNTLTQLNYNMNKPHRQKPAVSSVIHGLAITLKTMHAATLVWWVAYVPAIMKVCSNMV